MKKGNFSAEFKREFHSTRREPELYGVAGTHPKLMDVRSFHNDKISQKQLRNEHTEQNTAKASLDQHQNKSKYVSWRKKRQRI
ncbi:hypothetical protein ACLK1X_11365 [Escherichia coli]